MKIIQEKIHTRGQKTYEMISTPFRNFDGSISSLAILRDISERKRAEEELKNREKQLLNAQRLTHIGSWKWDINHNRTTWSDELYRIFGVESNFFDPSAYEAFVSCIHPEDQEYVVKVMEKSLKDLESFKTEYRIIRPDGDIRYVHAVGEVICDENGCMVCKDE